MSKKMAYKCANSECENIFTEEESDGSHWLEVPGGEAYEMFHCPKCGSEYSYPYWIEEGKDD